MEPDHSRWDYKPSYLDGCKCEVCLNKPKVIPPIPVEDQYYTSVNGQRMLK